MKSLPTLRPTLCLFALLIGAGSTAAADEMPKRKSGLWQISTENSMMPGRKMTMQQCIDKNTDANLMARQKQAKDCSEPKITRRGNRITIESTCKMEGSTATTRGQFTGNYDSAYSGEIVTTFVPPMRGIKENRMQIDARWSGPCAPGQKPGSTTMNIPGMGDINLEEMMKKMPGMQSR